MFSEEWASFCFFLSLPLWKMWFDCSTGEVRMISPMKCPSSGILDASGGFCGKVSTLLCKIEKNKRFISHYECWVYHGIFQGPQGFSLSRGECVQPPHADGVESRNEDNSESWWVGTQTMMRYQLPKNISRLKATGLRKKENWEV